MANKDISFVNGICKSRENQIISEEKLMRMIDSDSAEEAIKILAEVGFGGEVSNASPENYEELIATEENELFSFMKEYSPDDKLTTLLYLKNDFFNAECAVRAKHIKGFKSFIPQCTIVNDVLTEAVEGKYANLPKYLEKPMKEADELFKNGSATGANVSMIFLNAYYTEAIKVAKNADLKRHFIREIDCKNIGIALRSAGRDGIEKSYIKGGKLKAEDLEVLASCDAEKIRYKFAYTEYYDLISEAITAVGEGKPMVSFERLADSYLLKTLKQKRFETEGIFPLILYYFYKKNEIANIRVVMAGKLCVASKEQIKERLRENYAV